mgnify:FL=1
MCIHHYYRPTPKAQPLTAAEIQELKDEDQSDLLVELGGLTYNGEDLYYCDNHKECGFKTADNCDLDEDNLCEECAQGAREYAEYVDDVRWTYWHSVL